MDFLNNVFVLDTLFHEIIQFIQDATQDDRKQLVLLARHLGCPRHTGNMFKRVEGTLYRLYRLKSFGDIETSTHYTADEKDFYLRHNLNLVFSNPVKAGLIIAACFLAPLSTEDVKSARWESFMKEISVMDRSGYDPEFNFDPFFGAYTEQLHSYISPSPNSAKIVHDSIKEWMRNMQGRQLFAHLSKKLLPTSTRQYLRDYVDDLLEDPESATQASLEYLLYRKQPVEGASELKQRWYINGLTPRSYFVAGPTAFYGSKYLRDPFNKLCDSLSVTERLNRVNPFRLRIDSPLHHFLFYDLTSFTSNMATQRPFLEKLATEAQSVTVTIMDISKGAMEVSLGDLIQEYVESTTMHPNYECPSLGIEDCHGVAGFLGVYGNIATCNFLHGAVLLQVAESESGCGCAGDDAGISTKDDEKVYTVVSLIGILMENKTYSTEDGTDVVYLKRKTYIDYDSPAGNGYLTVSSYWQPPSLLPFTAKVDRRRFIETHKSEDDIKMAGASSIMAAFRSRLDIPSEYHEDALEVMLTYYTLLGFPTEGHVPQYGGAKWFIPSLGYFGSRTNHVWRTMEDLYPGQVRLDVIDAELKYPSEVRLLQGTVFKAKSNMGLRMLERLGYLYSVDPPKQIWVGEEGLDELYNRYGRGRSPSVHVKYYLVKELVPSDLYGGDLNMFVMGDICSTWELDNIHNVRDDVDLLDSMSGFSLYDTEMLDIEY